jgi:hypothetical protein
MIARCGRSTRVPDARSCAELADAARPLRRCQGRRDPGAASRGRRAAPQQLPAETDLARPRRSQRAEQAPPSPAAQAAARVAPNAAALARPAHRPPLDLPATTTRPTTHRTADPGPGAADGQRESSLRATDGFKASWSASATPSPRIERDVGGHAVPLGHAGSAFRTRAVGSLAAGHTPASAGRMRGWAS